MSETAMRAANKILDWCISHQSRVVEENGGDEEVAAIIDQHYGPLLKQVKDQLEDYQMLLGCDDYHEKGPTRLGVSGSIAAIIAALAEEEE